MVDLEYRETGSGPAVVILHGLFGSASNWSRHARELAPDYRVITPDLRNHGRSPHAPGMAYRELAADLLALLQRLAADPVALVGHSLGGKVAMACALLAPQAIERLMVVDIAPRRYRGRQATVFRALGELDLASLQSRREADARLATRIDDPGIRAFLLTNLVPEDGGYRWRINLAGLAAAADTIERFPAFDGSFNGPTAFVGGTASDYLDPARDRAAILRLFPAARIQQLAGAGHWLHAEQPEAFLELLRRFLAADHGRAAE